MRHRGLRALLALTAGVGASAAFASTAFGLPERDYGTVAAKLNGVPGASVSFYALTKKLLAKHGRPTSVTWAGVSNVPITCTQGTLKISNEGAFYVGSYAEMVPVSAKGAFTFAVQLAAYGYPGITMTVAGEFADHDMKVNGKVTLMEASPSTLYRGNNTPYTNCTVASAPYTFSAKPKWRSELY